MNEASAPATPPRSNFVTVVSWLFICLGAGLALIAVLQGVMFTALPMKEMQEQMNAAHNPMPGYTQFIYAHLGLYLAVSFISAVALFAIAIGLLKRKRWARPAMAVLLTLGVIKNLGSAALSAAYYASSPTPISMPTDMSQGTDAMVNSMVAISMLFGIVFSLAIAAALTWVVVRLLSAKVRAEFEPLPLPEAQDAPADAAPPA